MSTSENRLRKLADEIEPAEKRLYDKNDAIVARIHELLDERGLAQKDLAKQLQKSPSYVSRALGGAVNFTLKTICEFEEALAAPILRVVDTQKVAEENRTASSEHHETDVEYSETG